MVGGTSAGRDFASSPTVVPVLRGSRHRRRRRAAALLRPDRPLDCARHRLADPGRHRDCHTSRVRRGPRDRRAARDRRSWPAISTSPVRRRSGTRWRSSSPDGDESYLRAIGGTDVATGSVFVSGTIPVGATVQLTTADTAEILAGPRRRSRRATAEFPAGARPEAALIFSCAVRRFLLGSRTGVEAELARTVYGPSMPIAGLYCFGEIGPIRGNRIEPVLQRDLHDPAPRHVTDKPGRRRRARLATISAGRTLAWPGAWPGSRRPCARSSRSATPTPGCSTGSGTSSRPSGRRSHDLLLNVLPQPIIDRLEAGEGLIADRHDDVAVIFSDFVGFTEISSRLPVATLVSARTSCSRPLTRPARSSGSRRSRRSATPTWRPPASPVARRPRRSGARTWRSRCGRRSRRRRAMAGPDRDPPRPGRGRGHRHEQVRLRPVGRHRQRGQPARDVGAARPDPGLRGGRDGLVGVVRTRAARFDRAQGQRLDRGLLPAGTSLVGRVKRRDAAPAGC